MLSTIRGSLRGNRHWVALRRAQREGLGNAWRRTRLWSRILDTPPVVTEPVSPGATVETHLLCSYQDYLTAIWALKSFYHFAGVSYALVIHIQGNVASRVVDRLHHHFPQARLVLRPEADRLVEQHLSAHGFNRVLAARRASPFMLKLTDFPILSDAHRILMLDSDVIFFAEPAELLRHASSAAPVTVFQRDLASTYNIAEAEAYAKFGVRMAAAVNTGIALVPRQNVDFDRCEAFLAHPEVAKCTGWIEQTLYSLCASEKGKVAFLPESYLVSLDPLAILDGIVARHYAGLSRPLLTSEGMPLMLQLWNGSKNGRDFRGSETFARSR
jgi:hypothetical protein